MLICKKVKGSVKSLLRNKSRHIFFSKLNFISILVPLCVCVYTSAIHFMLTYLNTQFQRWGGNFLKKTNTLSQLPSQMTAVGLSESRSVMSNFLRLHGLYNSWNSLGQNTGMGSLSLLQGIFPTQGSNPGLPHCRQILYQLSYQGSLRILEWVAYPFSSGSSWPRDWTEVSCIADRFFASWATREAPYWLNYYCFVLFDCFSWSLHFLLLWLNLFLG